MPAHQENIIARLTVEEDIVKAVGVLCARVRVEEKQIIAAVGVAGAAGMPVPPPSTPLPPGPASLDLATLGIAQVSTSSGEDVVIDSTLTALIDRCQNRTIAAISLPILRASGITVLDAGLAADRNRLDVARVLATAGIARPHTLIAFSEESGIEAARRIGFPATLMPLTPGQAGTTLHDEDTADAVIEHRVVLGSDAEAIVLIQAGAPSVADRIMIHVVGGKAVAFDGPMPDAAAITLAEDAARAIGARIAGIEIATIGGQQVVWDVQPVAEFRQATLLGPESMADAIARAALDGDQSGDRIGSLTAAIDRLTSAHWKMDREARHDVVLSA
ncbi:MAG: hypothetical protein ACTHQE_10660 [Thermomicrobiales bacterium]